MMKEMSPVLVGRDQSNYGPARLGRPAGGRTRTDYATHGGLAEVRSRGLRDPVRMVRDCGSFSGRPDPMRDPMGEFIRQVQDLGDQNWAEQIDVVRDVFSSVAATVGVRCFSYHLLENPCLAPKSVPFSYMITTYPAGWAERYDTDSYVLADDPVAREALRSLDPFVWSQIEGAGETSGKHREFFGQAQAAGLGESITIPIHAEREVAMLSVAPHARDRRAVSRNIHLLYLMASFLHHHVRRAAVEMALTVSARRLSLLSPRETQILECAAQGQSTREISAGLGISPKGVDFHIDGARHKLHASNRTHAVAKAIMLGLLSADI